MKKAPCVHHEGSIQRPIKQYQSVTTDIDMAQNQLIDIGSLAKELKKELITDIQTTVEKTIEKYMIPIKRDLVKIKNDYQKLEQEVSDLRLKNDELEQYTRRYSLRISGIPETEGENPDDVVLNVSKIMNVDIALSDIDRTSRRKAIDK